MTKLVKKLLISLMAIVMTACCGFAVIGLNKTVVNAESTYDIKILGTALSDSNLTFNSSDNASVSGSITYSPEENKLTLNNFVFNGPSGDHVINVVKSTSTTLTVELIGDSEITITEDTSPYSNAISAFYATERGNICFVGGGSFTVDNSAFDSSTAALHAGSKDIFVYNSQLVGKGYNTGIYYDYRIVAYGENASILATATTPESTKVNGSLWIYPALARNGGFMYSKVNTQKVEVSFNIDGSDPSTSVDTDNKGIYASYKYFHITPLFLTVSAYKSDDIGKYYDFSPSSLYYGEKITVTPKPGYVLTKIQYTNYTYQPKATLQPDGSYVLDTADANYTQYDTIKFWADYAEAKTINKTPSVGGDYVVPSAGAYNKTVTITPTPNAGYYADTVTVTSASGNPIKVTGPNADGAYTFVMPKEEVSVSVDFKQLITYDVWVAGFRLDSRNLTINREDNYAITGSATYDAENNILTLDNFSYTGAGYNIGGNANALIYSTGSDLKIVLKGTNKLAGSVDVSVGIYIEDGSLTIAGSDEYSDTASLELTVYDECIYADYSLSIENVKLTTTATRLTTGNSSPTVAIYTEGDLSIMSSEVTVIAGDSDGDGIIEFGYTVGIISDENVEIIGSTVTVAANAGGIGAWNRMAIDDSTVIIDAGGGIQAAATSIKDSTVTISGEIAIETDTMYGGYFILSNSNVELSAQEYAIHDWSNDEPLADDRLDDITGHVIYGGEDKASATIFMLT